MSGFASALTELRRPFTPGAVKWKIQTNPRPEQNKKAMIVAHIDARLVAARLNMVAPEWSDEFEEGLHGSVLCRLTVCGHTRTDVGWDEARDGEGNVTDAGIKGLYSDAFKRAAVQFGVGAFLYSLPRQYAAAADLKQIGRSWYLTPALEKRLRDGYSRWLHDVGERDFGKPLDHGSVASEAADESATPEPNGSPKLSPEQAQREEKPLPKLTPEQTTRLMERVKRADLAGQPLSMKLRSLGAEKLSDLTVEQGRQVHAWAGGQD